VFPASWTCPAAAHAAPVAFSVGCSVIAPSRRRVAQASHAETLGLSIGRRPDARCNAQVATRGRLPPSDLLPERRSEKMFSWMSRSQPMSRGSRTRTSSGRFSAGCNRSAPDRGAWRCVRAPQSRERWVPARAARHRDELGLRRDAADSHGNTEGTPPRARASTRGHSSSADSSGLRASVVCVTRACPRFPSRCSMVKASQSLGVVCIRVADALGRLGLPLT
jgi:hypothetical protein